MYIIDANNKILGRIASEAACVLCGKRDPSYAPHLTPRHKVVVIHAARVRVTGTKRRAKIYKRFSGYPGGLKEISFETQLQKDPKRIIQHAVRSMLPKNKLRAVMMRNLVIHINE